MTIDQANSIMAYPRRFYVNIHTAANPGGVGARPVDGRAVRKAMRRWPVLVAALVMLAIGSAALSRPHQPVDGADPSTSLNARTPRAGAGDVVASASVLRLSFGRDALAVVRGPARRITSHRA
jgi:hypothetical protein